MIHVTHLPMFFFGSDSWALRHYRDFMNARELTPNIRVQLTNAKTQQNTITKICRHTVFPLSTMECGSLLYWWVITFTSKICDRSSHPCCKINGNPIAVKWYLYIECAGIQQYLFRLYSTTWKADASPQRTAGLVCSERENHPSICISWD